MRLSELSAKEMIDMELGERLGMVGETDFIIHETTGAIEAMLLQPGGFLGLGKKRDEIVIPWQAVRKVGPDMIIIELRQRGY